MFCRPRASSLRIGFGHELAVLGRAILLVGGAVVDLGIEVDPDQTFRFCRRNIGRIWGRRLGRAG